jgi:hypothetical protein
MEDGSSNRRLIIEQERMADRKPESAVSDFTVK